MSRPSFWQRMDILRQIPVFSPLNWLERQKIARKFELAHYKKGSVICRQGDPPDFFYCVVSGRVRAYTLGEGRHKENVEFIHRGMYFGIVSLLTGEGHSLSFEAVNDSVILKIGQKDFHEILAAVPRLGVTFSRALSQRVRHSVQGTKCILESTVIAVHSPTRGTGCSTYALNLALSLQEETRKKVLFVQIRPFREIRPDAEAAVKWTEAAVDWRAGVSDPGQIHQHIIQHSLPVDLLNIGFDKEDVLLKKEVSPLIGAFAGHYHYVIMDLPSESGEIIREALTQSDHIHLLSFDRESDLRRVRHEVAFLRTALGPHFYADRVHVLIRPLHAKVYLSFEKIDQFIQHHVHMTLPSAPPEHFVLEQSSVLVFCRGPERSEYAQAVRRMAREIGGVRVGLVLGGGAALGLAHIGVLRVLEREGIPVDIVVGSSMGALVGSLWVTGHDAARLEKIASEFKRKLRMLKLFDPVLPLRGLIGGRFIKRWLKRYLRNRTFYSTRIPFKVVAYDLLRREELVLNSGPLVEAVQQSIAIPGVIEPVRKEGRVIIDGGVLNPLPTNVLTALGIKKILAVNVLPSPEDTVQGMEITRNRCQRDVQIPFQKRPFLFCWVRLIHGVKKLFIPNISDIIVRTLQASEYVIAEQSARQADVTIHPDLKGIQWFELYKVDELIAAGEQAAVDSLPAIRRLLEADR